MAGEGLGPGSAAQRCTPHRVRNTTTLLPLLDRPGHVDRDRQHLFAGSNRRRRGSHRRRHLAAEYRRSGAAFFGDAERLAERDTRCLGVDFRLAARIGDSLRAGLIQRL